MRYAFQWVMSFIYVIQIYFMMLPVGLLFFPWAMFSRRGAIMACKTWGRWTLWSARWMVGIRTEVRGTPPTGEVMIAAKHHSFLDVMMIFLAVPAGKFIMKRELIWAPILGQYALKLGCVPIDRGKRSVAIKQMVKDVEEGSAAPGQLIIYSQGTRIAPGVKAPYKVGTGVLYQELGQPCVPVATNAGVVWPRTGIYRKPGLAVVEFLPEIAPGMERDAFMAYLETEVEKHSDLLLEEAGGF